MGRVYERGGKLYLDFVDAGGGRQRKSTGLLAGQESHAEKALDLVEHQVQAELELAQKLGADAPPPRGATLRQYSEHWMKRREKEKPKAAKENRWQLDLHILPQLGDLPLAEIRPRHARDFVRHLRSKLKDDGTTLAPRSIHTIYATLHCILHEAHVDELLPSNPCVLKRGELPPKTDKDPEWRAGAVYTKAEVEQLISDERIPPERRALNALLFLGGLRPGEAFALRWKHYDPTVEPLGRLDICRAWDSDFRVEKDTKMHNRRLAPAHATLAKVLAAWKLSGWQRLMGRPPTAEDLVVPEADSALAAENEAHITVDEARKRMHNDQEALGWRRRRLYDTRRTFISLVQGDGGSRDLLQWVSHGPRGDVIDLYTSIPWRPICAEISKLRVELLEGKLLQLPMPKAAAGGAAPAAPEAVCQAPRHSDGTVGMTICEGPRNQGDSEGPLWSGRLDLKQSGTQVPGPISHHDAPVSESEGGQSGTSSHYPPFGDTCAIVPKEPPAPDLGSPSVPGQLQVAADLGAALNGWLRDHDPAALAAQLEQLLARLNPRRG